VYTFTLINLQKINQLTFVNQKLPARHLSCNYAILIPSSTYTLAKQNQISERRKNSVAQYILLLIRGTLNCQLDFCEVHSKKIAYAGKILNVRHMRKVWESYGYT